MSNCTSFSNVNHLPQLIIQKSSINLLSSYTVKVISISFSKERTGTTKFKRQPVRHFWRSGKELTSPFVNSNWHELNTKRRKFAAKSTWNKINGCLAREASFTHLLAKGNGLEEQTSYFLMHVCFILCWSLWTICYILEIIDDTIVPMTIWKSSRLLLLFNRAINPVICRLFDKNYFRFSKTFFTKCTRVRRSNNLV